MKKYIQYLSILSLILGSFSVLHAQGTLDNETFQADANAATSGFSFWNNVTGDDDNWQVESPNVGNSGNTGPLNGSGHSKYLYIEASGNDAQTAGKEFWLVSDVINPNTNPISTVEFDYHMYGATMGALTLEYSTSGTDDDDFKVWWAIAGQQQTSETQAYNSVTVDFYGVPVTYLRFKGIDGSSYTGDIALDNITVSYGAPLYDIENFEADANAATSGFSFWNNVSGDQANWQVESPNTTNSGTTGPLNGYGHSKYLYTENSSPRVSGDEFWLVSDQLSGTVSSVYFEYHMFGDAIGTLSLEYSSTGTADNDFNTFWALSGEQQGTQEDPYQPILLDLSGIDVNYLRLVGTNGGTYSGDISIDNIAVSPGPALQPIPTLSEWGVIILSLLVISVCSVMIWNMQYDPKHQVAFS